MSGQAQSQTVPVIFCRSHWPGSLLLRTLLWSQWSHCAIVDRERGEVIEAACWPGVRATPLDGFLAHHSRWEIVEIPVTNAAAVVAAARSQIGQPYDWMGVLGIGLRRCWESQTRWFCSEIVAWAFATGGTPLVRIAVWRITPRDLYLPLYRPG